MRKVVVSHAVWDQISELRIYMTSKLKMSEEAARKRSDRMRQFVASLGNPAEDIVSEFLSLCKREFYNVSHSTSSKSCLSNSYPLIITAS